MTLPLSKGDQAFQAEVRDFVKRNLPADIRARILENRTEHKPNYTR